MTINAAEIYTVSEAAKLLKRSKTFILDRCREGALTHIRPSKNVIMIRGKDLLTWLDAHLIRSDATPSCGSEERDGAPSGTPSPSEKLAAGAARSVAALPSP
jgi:hypothetical protein